MTKKLIALFLSFAMLFSIAACADTQTESKEPDSKAQLQLLADNLNIWKREDKGITPYFAVCDLDQDGYLELITTLTEGTGKASENNFYKVNEDMSGLVKIRYEIPEGSSEPDISSPIKCYVTDGKYDYVLSSFYADDSSGYMIKYALFLGKDYQGSDYIDMQQLGSSYYSLESISGYGDRLATISYYSTTGEEITREDYLKLESDYFEGSIESVNAYLSWEEMPEEENALELVTQSYQGFGFRKPEGMDDKGFSELFDLFDEGEQIDSLEASKTETGSFAYSYDDLVSNSWYLTAYEIEGYMESAKEADFSGEFYAYSDGKCTFNFTRNEENTSSYSDMYATPFDGEMYTNCPNNEWYIAMESDEENYFKVTMTGEDKMEMLWYQGVETPDSYPAVCMLYFSTSKE